MSDIKKLLENNKSWAKKIKQEDPNFFTRLAKAQNPEYLWIGCSDSRIPANQVMRLIPGEVFVHRNIANVVVHTDLNCLSVIHFAVNVLKVKHIIVCGHYACGGVIAAMQKATHSNGLLDSWLQHVRDTYFKFFDELKAIESEKERVDRLCELNVIEQVKNVCVSTPVIQAWRQGQSLQVHAWIYDVADGIIRNLDYTKSAEMKFPQIN